MNNMIEQELRETEQKLRKIIMDTEKNLEKFLTTFYKKIDNLENFHEEEEVKETLQPLKDFWKKNKQFRLGGIFLWNDINKEHIFSGEHFSTDIKKDRKKIIKEWLFSGEKNKEIELLVKFVLEKWKNKEKVIQISTEEKTDVTVNNSDLIDLIFLENCDKKMREKIPSLIKQNEDYYTFFGKKPVKELINKYTDIFKNILMEKLIFEENEEDKEDNKLVKLSTNLAKNITLMYGYDEKWRHIYIIPALIYRPAINVKVKGNSPTGGLFIGTNQEIPEEMLFLFKVFITTISSQIALIFQNREIASHSLRSAISAIMGRNMSHNIGSHVMARISTGGINGRTTGKSIDDIIKGLTDEKHKKDIIVWSKDIQFLSRYIQQRMDFIAQIATDWPTWTEPAYLMNDLMRWFLSQKHLLNYIAASEGLRAHSFMNNEESKFESIIDEGSQTSEHKNGSHQKKNIEVDKKEAECNSEPKEEKKQEEEKPGDIRFHIFMVHEDCWNKNCIVHETVKKRIVEKRKDAIKNDCKDKKELGEGNLGCKPEENTDQCKKCRRILLYTPEKEPAECRVHEDFPLAIPGGIVGYHAFYIILENIIRNGAKHDYTRRKDEVDKHFDVVIEVLYDPDETICIKKGDKKIPAFLFRIYNNTSKLEVGGKSGDDDLIKRMNKFLRSSIITETGELNKGNWGLSEMKIAAGFLQQRDIAHIGDGKERVTGKKTDFFKTLGEDNNGSDAIIRAVKSPIGTLGYEFYIPKPRTVGIVCPGGKKETNNGR